jgi:hypothetical protein
MKRFALMLLALCLSLPVLAERKKSFDDLDVHYSVFNSSFLQPEVAAAKQLVRGKNQGVVNIAVLKAGKPSMATVSGVAKDLVGREQPLTFRQVTEGEAIYYLAQFTITQQEMLRFTLNVSAGGSEAHRLEFNQEVFPEP